jgi:hypothetical protein
MLPYINISISKFTLIYNCNLFAKKRVFQKVIPSENADMSNEKEYTSRLKLMGKLIGL